MNFVRAAAALAVIALSSWAAQADVITLTNSPSVQARWEGEWQKTHPMHNQSNPAPQPSGRCNLVIIAGPGGTRTTICR